MNKSIVYFVCDTVVGVLCLLFNFIPIFVTKSKFFSDSFSSCVVGNSVDIQHIDALMWNR